MQRVGYGCTLSAVGDKKKQCTGLVPLCEGLEHGSSSVEEGVELPAIAPSGW